MICPSCGTANDDGKKFCVECGTPLGGVCPSCGAALSGGEKFCGECGASLPGGGAVAPAPARGRAVPSLEPTAERRLVSVLFVDLVGFTSLSEARDAEETRELLSSYFETARTLIERYGGTVEKFIGDAVMAVWGAPAAREDDAERAVRAALDLVAAVPELDPALRARAGVLTGEAAVTLGAHGEGMVAGDLVNTASRIQSAAEPGTVLVGESTKRASEAAISYEEAGSHALKGKAATVLLWRALRVTAARGGALKAEALEPPFVGRERDLHLVKDLFHASADDKRAQLVSIVGIAGIGKSRLVWEFEKYIDGLAEQIWFWRGRCLAYGEGVTYWALAEMVRRRADIVEREEPESARRKLAEALVPWIADAEERAWIEPRLAQLLGLEHEASHEREDLFAAWRLYFERLSEHRPAVLVFEDMQWADVSLLEFVDYMLEWSRSYPIFVLALARPDLIERHPGFGAGRRNATTLALEPLTESAMNALLSGLVPGLPADLHAQILARAEGVPLYAVETVRMLLDRGLVERAGDEYRPTGRIEALEVPETLHALIAARLDGLSTDERRLVQDGSVLGTSFTRDDLSALSGRAEHELEPLLQALLRKEVLFVQADPRSPERGQYGFVQDLIKRVAYETLAMRERKARHLAAAAHLESAFGAAEQEIIEVIASHYVSAFEAAPEAEDAADIKERAREMLARAGERAASLGANEEAARYFEQAAYLADEAPERAVLLERAGEGARAAGRLEVAKGHFESAVELFEGIGETHPAARVSARLGRVLHDRGRIDEAVVRMEEALGVLAADEPDGDLAALAHELARVHLFRGEPDRAMERVELALDVAESLRLPEVISQSLNTKALALQRLRPREARALMHEALQVALEHDLTAAALRAYNNLSVLAAQHDLFDEYLRAAQDALALAQRRGDRGWEWNALTNLVECLFVTGAWDEALARAADLPDEARSIGFTYFPAEVLVRLHAERGEREEAIALMSSIAEQKTSADLQARGVTQLSAATLARAEGKYADALAAAEDALECVEAFTFQYAPEAGAELSDAALELGDLDRVDQLLAEWAALKPVRRTQSLVAHEARIKARLAARRGESERVEPRFLAAAARFRELGTPFWLAVTLLEHGEWLVAEGRADDSEVLFAEAREIFERLRAQPWLDRLTNLRAEVVAHRPSGAV